MEKLIAARVVERLGWELTFTREFGAYLCRALPANLGKAGRLIEWRNILGEFEPSLAFLTGDEVATIIVLLDYHVKNIESPSQTTYG